MGLGDKTLSRRFLAHTGTPPVRFRTEPRLQQATRLPWPRPDLPEADSARTVGFDDVRFFRRMVRHTFGLTPSQLGRRAGEP